MIAAGTALVFAAGAQLTLGYGVKILIDEGFAGPDPSGLYKAVVFMLVVGIAMAIGAMVRFYLVSWSKPARVVAPTSVNGGKSSFMERAAGPSPIMMSSW